MVPVSCILKLYELELTLALASVAFCHQSVLRDQSTVLSAVHTENKDGPNLKQLTQSAHISPVY